MIFGSSCGGFNAPVSTHRLHQADLLSIATHMRFQVSYFIWSFIVLGGSGIGCSAPNAVDAVPPTQQSDSQVVATDAASSNDAGTDAAVAEPVACADVLSNAIVTKAILGVESGTSFRTWVVSARNGDTFFTLTVRESQGAKPGISSGAFEVDTQRPADVPVSLLVQSDCHAHGDHFHCGPTFLPMAGTWAFTALPSAVGQPLALELSATMAEARLRAGKATWVTGGKTICVQKLKLEASVKAP